MKKRKIFLIIFGLSIINACFLIALIFGSPTRKELKVIFFDVGQGDASLIMAENGVNILIDGGPDKTIIEKLDNYLPFYKRKIDILILTHPHSDHVIGLIDVLKKYEVREVWRTGIPNNSPEYLEFLKIIQDKKIATTVIGKKNTAKPGDKNVDINTSLIDNGVANGRGDAVISRVGEYKISPSTILEVLYPAEDFLQKNVDNLNNSSIVLKIKYKDKSFLFTGDIEKEVEEEMVQAQNLKSTVLKIAHHGSRNSSTEEFIKKVSPEIAVISVGKDNDFSFPSLRVIKRLERMKIKTLRTDIYGDLILLTDGKEIMIP